MPLVVVDGKEYRVAAGDGLIGEPPTDGPPVLRGLYVPMGPRPQLPGEVRGGYLQSRICRGDRRDRGDPSGGRYGQDRARSNAFRACGSAYPGRAAAHAATATAFGSRRPRAEHKNMGYAY